MSFKKSISFLSAAALVLTMLAGCSSDTSSQGSAGTDSGADSVLAENTASSSAAGTDTDEEMFTARDKEVGYEESECETITLADGASQSSLESVKIDGDTITVSEEATYIVSGSLSDGQIVIEGDKSEKIRLILNGVTINSSTSAPIYVKQTDKLFITLAEGSENKLTNSTAFTADGDTNVDAVIFSKEDLTLNGKGSLEIITTCGHGIVSKDDLKITSGTYTINASSHALSGKDSVRVLAGTLNLTAGKDGIHSENADDTSLGYIYIEGGTFNITSDGDGMDASAALTIKDLTASITSGGGEPNAEAKHDEFEQIGAQNSTDDTDENTSAKGIKSTGTLAVSGGSFTLDCADDAIHSNADVSVSGGTFDIKTGDDGMHADNDLSISNGEIEISESYEGIEGLTIEVSGGIISIVASDDGFNAAGGNDESGFGGQMPQDNFGSDSSSSLTISGGTINVDAQGDGIDSNGALTVSGGEIYVTGPSTGGNGALDYGGDAAITGGTLIAVGMSGMAQNFGSSSTQGSILCNTASTVSGEVTLKDSSGNVIASYTPTREYNSVVVSCAGVTSGSTYTLSMGGNETEIEMTSLIYGSGDSMGGDPGAGGQGAMGGNDPGAGRGGMGRF